MRECGVQDRWIVILAFACVAVFSATLANVEGVWIDERITIMLIERWTAWEILTVLPTIQPHLPTWYLLPEFVGVRVTVFVSMLSFATVVYPTFRLGERLGAGRGGAIAGLLVALSPFLAAQAGWLRMYAVVTALLTWGLWWCYDGSFSRAIVCMIVAAAIHPFGIFGLGWMAIRLSATKELDWKRGAALALGPLPTAGLLVAHLANLGDGVVFTQRSTGVGHGIEPSLLKIVLTPASALVGSPHEMGQVFGVLLVTAILVYRWPERWLALWVILPLSGIVASSYVLHPVFRLKYFGFVAPVIAVAAATGPEKRWERALLAVLLSLLLGWSWLQRTIPTVVARRFIFWF